MKKEKSELIQEALDTLQAVTLSWMSVESYVAELFENIRNLEEENKKLNEKIKRLEFDVDAWHQLKLLLEWEIEKLKAELEETKNTLEHRDSFFSIMRDVLANETITNNEIAMIVYCVVHEECGDYDLSEKELEVVKKFRNREYV